MFVGGLVSDRTDCRVFRSQDGVKDIEVHYHGVLADSFRLEGGSSRCLEIYGVDSRRKTPPMDTFEILVSVIWTRALCLGERCRSRHAVDD